MVHRVISRCGRAYRVILGVSMTLGAIALALAAFLWIGNPNARGTHPREAGVTFSIPYAKSLGLNWRETLTAALDDLGVRYFRIPAYWSAVQPLEDAYAWGETDYQMDEIALRDGRVTLAVGAKLPRWPECWMPNWIAEKTPAEEHAARLAYIREAVLRYKDHPALAAWQVENEALFPFGVCPKPDKAFFKQELALVRSLDPNHPIFTTDSGELSTWLSLGPLVDKLGVSVYRVVLTPRGAIWRYTWIPPYWYARHAMLVSAFVKEIYVSEFQMEPWADVLLDPLEIQFKTFSPEQMKKNFEYANRMNIPSISFWGVEWWWWAKTVKGDSRFWDLAREYFRKSATIQLQ